MRRLVLFSLLVSILPVASNAQDDMYFSPKKNKVEKKAKVGYNDSPTYYSGSNRSVDEYNRRGYGSYYHELDDDSIGNDIIDFYGSVPDSTCMGKGNISKRNYEYDDDDYDYAYSRRMRYFDDFFWYDDPWLYGYSYYGPYYSFGWGRPWRYGYYGGWYDPWYYGYYGWYDPWFYGWNRPYWGPTIAYRPVNRGGITGTSSHGWVDNGRRGDAKFSGYRESNSTSNRNIDAYNRQNSNRNFSGYRGQRDNSMDKDSRFDRNDNFSRNDNFNRSGYRNESNFNSSSYNRSNSSSFGGGFSSGSRGGGFGGGGGRSGGGGHFGGRR